VTAGRENFESTYLIGADGVYTVVGAWSGLVRNRRIGSALEVEVTGLAQDRRTALIDFGRVRGGYSWSFPKGGRFSVGLGGRQPAGLKAELANWLDHLGYRGEKELKPRGHALPEARIGAPLQQGNLLLVGDAAGLVNPLTGEGIRYAVQSAQLAAAAVISGRLAAYSRAVKEQITGDFLFSYWLRAFFFRWPGFCYRVFVKNQGAARALSRAFCGETTFRELFFSSGRKLLKGKVLHAG
jgi:flavin-dependent dehydrogenase